MQDKFLFRQELGFGRKKAVEKGRGVDQPRHGFGGEEVQSQDHEHHRQSAGKGERVVGERVVVVMMVVVETIVVRVMMEEMVMMVVGHWWRWK